jgi:hypothetical protein
MPLDPFTGRYLPYDGSNPGTGPPGALESISEAQPGFIHSSIIAGTRGSSTMMYGGFDASVKSGFGLTTGTADKIYEFSSRAGNLDDLTPIGRAMVGRRGATQFNPIVKPALRNFTPKALLSGQFSDLSIFAPLSQNRYTPSGFTASMLNTVAQKSSKFRGMMGIEDGVDTPFGSGFMSSLQATSRTDALEKKLVKAIKKGDKRTIGKITGRLGQVDRSTEALLRMNNPGMLANRVVRGNAVMGMLPQTTTMPFGSFGQVGSSISFGPSNLASAQSSMIGAGNTAGQIGIRGNLMVSGLSTATMQGYGGFFRAAGGYGASTGYQGFSAAAKAGALRADKAFLGAAKAAGFDQASRKAMLMGTEKIGITKGLQIAKTGAGGAKFMAARGVQVGAKFAGPVGWVMLAYDVGKLAGQGVANGIDLAKDAVKSFQGSIYKPAFGMGYRDNETAATSRARGVMAIQNSRLNARSVLGSEAGMMAAHFG